MVSSALYWVMYSQNHLSKHGGQNKFGDSIFQFLVAL